MKKAFLVLAIALVCSTASADKLSSAVADFRISLLDLNLSTCKNKVSVEGGEGAYTCAEMKRQEIITFRKGSFEKIHKHRKVQSLFRQ